MVSDCSRCSDAGGSIFGALERKYLARLEALRLANRVPAGHVFCEEGDPARIVYCILEGAVKLVKTGERGDNQVIRLLGPQDVFGLRPLLAGDEYSVRAIALEETVACAVPRTVVTELIEASRPFAAAVMAHLARELRLSEEMLMILTQRSVRHRVAELLLLLDGRRTGREQRRPLPAVRLKRREMAQMVGTTPETLSRTLAGFAREGLIHVDRRNIVILDPDGLRKPERRAGRQ